MFIIAGLYRHQRLLAPKGERTRPTANRLREMVFNICQQVIEGAHFLDLFAGSGAMGLEAISRGAQSATFIEIYPEAIRCLQQNIAHLKVQDKCQVLQGEVLAMLKRLDQQKKSFDIIYADPPYHTPVPYLTELFYSEQIVRWIDAHGILRPGGLLFVEEEFRYQPLLEDLEALRLKDSRRVSHTALQQYIRDI